MCLELTGALIRYFAGGTGPDCGGVVAVETNSVDIPDLRCGRSGSGNEDGVLLLLLLLEVLLRLTIVLQWIAREGDGSGQ